MNSAYFLSILLIIGITHLAQSCDDNSFEPRFGWFVYGRQGVIDEAKMCLKWAPRALDKFIKHRQHNGSAKAFADEAGHSFESYLDTMMTYEKSDQPNMVLFTATRALLSLTNLSVEMKSLTELIPEKKDEA
ncbi:uncharacterized protein LOC141850779 [Brevipalpus obovatus]|uniref:uncharacterized protein LOC141850779 n=1 Tax=Brevipalpus obovatus TaxID=246614 RepID=UPI003D9FAFC9